MKSKLVQTSEAVTLVGGAAVEPGDLAAALALAPVCVAADGGAAAALAAGIELAAVIGDMDSIAPGALRQIPADRVHRIDEQTSTDFDKALRHIAAPAVIAVGFAGGRIDHQLAAFHTMVLRADQPCVLLGAQEIVFACPPRIALPTREGDTVSLFPLAPGAGRSTGLAWAIDGLAFDAAAKIGTSNMATGPVTLEMDGPGMLACLPRRLIRPVVQALAALPAHGRWPARAEPRIIPR